MTASLQAKSNGTEGVLLVNGSESVVFDSTGIVSGVNKSAVSQQATLGTAVATTSGTSHDLTGIPSWVKRITILFDGVSSNGTSNYLIQLGDSGGLETSGVTSRCTSVSTSVTSTAGFLVTVAMSAATDTQFGAATLTLLNSSTNTWVYTSVMNDVGQNGVNMGAGAKTLSGTLDRIRLTTVNGTDAFDAGSINILYE